MWEMGVGGISLRSTASLRLAVAERGRACWYILVGLTVLSCGRAVDVALWTTGRNTLAIEAILLYFKVRRGKMRMKRENFCAGKGRCRIGECTKSRMFILRLVSLHKPKASVRLPHVRPESGDDPFQSGYHNLNKEKTQPTIREIEV